MPMSNDKERVEALIRQLEDEDELVRENSAYLLGEIGAEARELTKNTLKNGRMLDEINALTIPQVREKVVKRLIKALFDKDGWVRGNAADALGKIGHEKAVEPLIAALKDEDKVVRFSAAEALGELQDERAIESIITALRDDDWSVRVSAAEALGKIGTLRALEALTVATGDGNRDVQTKAAEALAKLSGLESVSEASSPGAKARKSTTISRRS